jgi:hypothetical protein
MSNQVEDIMRLINNDKEKSNTYDRYPIRFIFMRLNKNTEQEVQEIITRLNYKHAIKEPNYNEVLIVDIAKLITFQDGWITKSQLFSSIQHLNNENDYIILGFSELIRFYSSSDLEAIIMSFMSNVENGSIKNKQRIYFICFSLYNQLINELSSNGRNKMINPVLCSDSFLNKDDHLDTICVYYSKSDFCSNYIKNRITSTYEWLSLYKNKNLDYENAVVCVSDTLVLLYEKAKPDNFVSIELIDSFYSMLTKLFRFKLSLVKQEYFDDLFWRDLFELCNRHLTYSLNNIISIYLNLTEIMLLISFLFLKRLICSGKNY